LTIIAAAQMPSAVNNASTASPIVINAVFIGLRPPANLV
jgi:hypothetical protein